MTNASDYIIVNPDGCLTVFGPHAHKLYFANKFKAPKVFRLDDSERFFVIRSSDGSTKAAQSTHKGAMHYFENGDVLVWRKGCRQPTHVEGTNGGTMPCGANLTQFGKTAPYYCAVCE